MTTHKEKLIKKIEVNLENLQNTQKRLNNDIQRILYADLTSLKELKNLDKKVYKAYENQQDNIRDEYVENFKKY